MKYNRVERVSWVSASPQAEEKFAAGKRKICVKQFNGSRKILELTIHWSNLFRLVLKC